MSRSRSQLHARPDDAAPLPQTVLEQELNADLAALRSDSARDLPVFEETARAARVRQPRTTREGLTMSMVRQIRMRPWLSTAVAVAGLAALMLVIPISYERTVGHQVAVDLTGNTVSPAAAGPIASALGKSLGATNLNVSSDDAGVHITADVPTRSGKQVSQIADAFAQTLIKQGVVVQTSVTPKRERVSSNVYAMAHDRAVEIRIDRGSRTPAELEADIRSQLMAAGLPNADVHVSFDGDKTQINIEADAGTAGASGATTGGDLPDLQLKIDGQTPDPSKAHTVRVERAPGMTDEQLKAQVEQQMRDQGLTADVSFVDGKLKVENVRKQ